MGSVAPLAAYKRIKAQSRRRIHSDTSLPAYAVWREGCSNAEPRSNRQRPKGFRRRSNICWLQPTEIPQRSGGTSFFLSVDVPCI
jgi:hypothetical protein